MIKIIFLIVIAEIWNTAGQILFKKTANAIDRPHLKTFGSYVGFIQKAFGMPGVWLGLGSMGIGLVVWLVALAQSELSVAFPMASLQYILILFAARIFLGEKIGRMKLAGTALIVAGITLIALS